MSSTRKPVIVRKWTRDWCAGYTVSEFIGDFPALELLDSAGKLLRIPWDSIKWVCYVREFPASASAFEKDNPERLLRRRFTSKPRAAGLWLRLLLGDGEELDGIAANDRSLIQGLGLMLIPPDTRSNTQKIFVPKSSIREFTLVGIVAPTTPRSSGSRQSKESAQNELFAGADEGEQTPE